MNPRIKQYLRNMLKIFIAISFGIVIIFFVLLIAGLMLGIDWRPMVGEIMPAVLIIAALILVLIGISGIFYLRRDGKF